ncbi:MAG: ABC transporter substrate-binding protein [Methylomicrobium sp.]
MIVRFLFSVALWSLSIIAVRAETNQQIDIVYFSQEKTAPPALSNLDPFIKDKGLPGAELAISDNNTTGQFTGQRYNLTPVIVPVDGDVVRAFQDQVAGKFALAVVNLPAEDLSKIITINPSEQTLIFDVGTSDDVLRQRCGDDVLHILPSRAMRADALGQYLLKKRWTKWFLVTGPEEEDRLFAAAIKRAAKRFGIKIVAEKSWDHTYDARRTAQSDVPVFTQGVDYDMLIVADEQGVFGEYLDYRTWIPRPVAGTQGLVATAWHRTHEQWGAVQIQNRFKDKTGRWMEEQDYAAYLAVRAVGEAATRTRSNRLSDIKSYLFNEQFALQGYKGRALSFRAWNGQLRQPILLAAPRSLVSVAPIEGFLHPKTELDTLGYDEPEIKCK